MLNYRAMVGRLGEAKRSGQPEVGGEAPSAGARVKCSEFLRVRAGSFTVKACDPWKSFEWRWLRSMESHHHPD